MSFFGFLGATPEPSSDNKQDEAEEAVPSFWALASSTLNTIKQKTEAVIETAKHDLVEFSAQLKNETQEIIRERASSSADTAQPAASEAPSGPASGATGTVLQAPTGPRDRRPSMERKSSAGPKKDSGAGDQDRVWGVAETVSNSVEEISEKVEKIADKVWSSALSVFGLAESGQEQSSEPSVSPSPVLSAAASERAYRARVEALQSARMTYLVDPKEPEFAAYQQTFDEKVYDAFTENQEVVQHLTSPHIRRHYDELVPEVVDERMFWCRYLFRFNNLQQEEARRKALVSRLVSQDSGSQGDTDLRWDDDEPVAPVTTSSHSSASLAPSSSSSSSSSSLSSSSSSIVSPSVVAASPSASLSTVLDTSAPVVSSVNSPTVPSSPSISFSSSSSSPTSATATRPLITPKPLVGLGERQDSNEMETPSGSAGSAGWVSVHARSASASPDISGTATPVSTTSSSLSSSGTLTLATPVDSHFAPTTGASSGEAKVTTSAEAVSKAVGELAVHEDATPVAATTSSVATAKPAAGADEEGWDVWE